MYNKDIKKELKFGEFVEKLNPYAKPRYYVAVGLTLSAIQGGALPIFALLLTKTLFNMQIPDLDKMYKESSFWVMLMFVVSIGSYINTFFYKYTFGIVGTNIIRSMRK